ncbi:MAG: hypothetical protein ACT4OD_07480 [Candidatus Nitrosotenuis sp.]
MQVRKMIEENEKIKWMVSRVDLAHDLFIKELAEMEKGYEKLSDNSSSSIKEIRNYILSGIGIALSILFGYNSTYPLEQWIFFVILIPLLAIGFFIFIIMNWIDGQIRNIFSDLSLMVKEQTNNLLHSKGYSITNVAKIENVTYEYAENYLMFLVLLSAATFAKMSKDLKLLARKYFYLKDVKKALEREAKTYEQQISEEAIRNAFDKLNRSFALPEKLMNFIDENLKKFKK